MRLTIQELMDRTGVRFGTSGARGLAAEMTDAVCGAYTQGFLQYLRDRGAFPGGGRGRVAVAGDLRPSTGRILAAVCRAVTEAGGTPVPCGRIPSPAVALYGLEERIPSIMVTGSHIPDDRNGIKFNTPSGELLKEDEVGVMAQTVAWDPGASIRGPLADAADAAGIERVAEERYARRYREAFPGRPLAGRRIGVYQHSAVGRDLVAGILGDLGAEVVPLGRADRFIPVDTEAIRPEDELLAREWAAEGGLDTIVSTDGDSDRPLISDAAGRWLRGDIAGILTARFLGADSVTTPVSSNSAVERCGWFPEVRRTRIGSPYVVAAMNDAVARGRTRVVGYEANGGFLVASDLRLATGPLRALPTRDALIVILGVLLLATAEGKPIADLVAALPARFTASGRLQDFPVARSRAILERMGGGGEANAGTWNALFGPVVGARLQGVDGTDGLRGTFDNGEIVHLRPSGNAPEFRCYTEAASEVRAREVCEGVLAVLSRGTAG